MLNRGLASLVEKFDDAAVRHYRDALQLAELARYDNAGHLIGLSAECAIKHAFNMRSPIADEWRKHLPQLAAIVRRRAKGRNAMQYAMYNLLQQLRAIYFNDWAIQHRYYRDGTVSKEIFEKWSALAKRTLGAALLRWKQ